MNNLAKHWGGDIRYVVPQPNYWADMSPPFPHGFGAYGPDLTRSIYGDAKLTPRTGRGADTGIARSYTTTLYTGTRHSKEDHPSLCFVDLLMRCCNQNGYIAV